MDREEDGEIAVAPMLIAAAKAFHHLTRSALAQLQAAGGGVPAKNRAELLKDSERKIAVDYAPKGKCNKVLKDNQTFLAGL